MSVLVVVVHPLQESFVRAIFDRVAGVLSETGTEHTVVDLYREGYVPPAGIPRSHRDALAAARKLVLVHPTWWGTQPAILSGWLAQASRADLGGIERLVCFATHGGGRWANWLSGEAGRQFMATRFRRVCAPDARLDWIGCYGLDRSRASDRTRFLDHAETMARRLLLSPVAQILPTFPKDRTKEKLE